jgi:hypothetical protein
MSAYDRVLEKYDWAKTHVDNFEAALLKFRRENPHIVGRKHNLEIGTVTYYVEKVPIIDPELLNSLLGSEMPSIISEARSITWLAPLSRK